MNMGRLSWFIGTALLLAAPSLTVAKVKPNDQIQMMPIDNQKAVALFDEICVKNYLDKSMLAAKMISDDEPWMLHRQKRTSDVTGMVYFESRQGEIGYINYPKQRPAINDPACHFTFIADQTASHKNLVALASATLMLRNGKDMTSNKSRQMRWDYQDIGGAPARIFVTTGLKANGRTVSRLSISKHRTPEQAQNGQTT